MRVARTSRLCSIKSSPYYGIPAVQSLLLFSLVYHHNVSTHTKPYFCYIFTEYATTRTLTYTYFIAAQSAYKYCIRMHYYTQRLYPRPYYFQRRCSLLRSNSESAALPICVHCLFSTRSIYTKHYYTHLPLVVSPKQNTSSSHPAHWGKSGE